VKRVLALLQEMLRCSVETRQAVTNEMKNHAIQQINDLQIYLRQENEVVVTGWLEDWVYANAKYGRLRPHEFSLIALNAWGNAMFGVTHKLVMTWLYITTRNYCLPLLIILFSFGLNHCCFSINMKVRGLGILASWLWMVEWERWIHYL
jgi:hypothetical protein